MAIPGMKLARMSRITQTVRPGAFRAPARYASTSAARPSNPVRTGLYTTLFVVSTGLFAVYYFDSRSAVHRYVLTPLLRHLVDAETGHKIAVKVLRSGLGPKDTQADDEVLRFEVCLPYLRVKFRFDTIPGSSSGADNFLTLSGLPQVSTRMEKPSMVRHVFIITVLSNQLSPGLLDLGFSWVEVGSVTPKPQVCPASHSPPPRSSRTPRRVLTNTSTDFSTSASSSPATHSLASSTLRPTSVSSTAMVSPQTGTPWF